MPDELRTRIASAIYNDNGFGWSKYMCEEAADAVIAELGLREETCVMANLADHDKRVIYTKVPLRRYVTEWTPDD